VPQDVKDLLRPITVFDTGGGHDRGQDEPGGVNGDVTLTPLDLLARVITPQPPFPAAFTDWLSMMPAPDWRRLPAATRALPRSRSRILGQVPSFRQRQKYRRHSARVESHGAAGAAHSRHEGWKRSPPRSHAWAISRAAH
jgi:hypothetical protein